MGCQDCKHRYQLAGDMKCDIEPHDYSTAEQRAVVRWLGVVSDPFRDGGCPSWNGLAEREDEVED